MKTEMTRNKYTHKYKQNYIPKVNKKRPLPINFPLTHFECYSYFDLDITSFIENPIVMDSYLNTFLPSAKQKKTISEKSQFTKSKSQIKPRQYEFDRE